MGAAAVGLAGLAPTAWGRVGAAPEVRITLSPQKVMGAIPADFVGLGYEISSVAEPGLLSGKNRRLIQFVRTLGARGGIRIGGDTSDDAKWMADGKAVSAPRGTVVNRRAIGDLGDFLRETRWKLIWGLNLGSGTAGPAAVEARAVADAAGNALAAFQIGNEPDLFVPRHRQRGYGYPQFLEEYRRFKKVVRAQVPDAPFAGPDAASKTEWVERFARDEGHDIKLLTRHYYAQGPPENASTTIPNLLSPRPAFEKTLARMRAASRASGVPYRFCEVNSCFHGGKPGVSDTFASALWVLELMHVLASYDCAGINVETGVNQLGFVSHYSPIYPDGHGGYVARPIYYGMLAFALGARGRRIGVQSDPATPAVKAYATIGDDHRVCLTLINQDMDRDAIVRVAGADRAATATISRLTAPEISSKQGVTLAGAMVDPAGRWARARRERITARAGQFELDLPAASAAVVEIQGAIW